MQEELRCGSRILHGKHEDGILEVTCRSRWCGKRPGVVIVHRFDLQTNELIETRQFKEPKEVTNHGSSDASAALRSA